MKDMAGKRGVSTKTQYQRSTIASNNNADKQVTRLNTGRGDTFRITQVQPNGKTLTGRGSTLAQARKALDAAVGKQSKKK
jgi:asparagine N-glycosylation enzyme membrane subunit Stt3